MKASAETFTRMCFFLSLYIYIYIILKVKALARKAGDPWFDSRLWRILIFSIFLRILKIVSVCTEKGEILVAR